MQCCVKGYSGCSGRLAWEWQGVLAAQDIDAAKAMAFRMACRHISEEIMDRSFCCGIHIELIVDQQRYPAGTAWHSDLIDPNEKFHRMREKRHYSIYTSKMRKKSKREALR